MESFREDNRFTRQNKYGQVAVIIQFIPSMDPIFEGIQSAGEFHQLRVERVKDVLGDYRIVDKILDMIHGAFLVVADLTYPSPNVYFELGYARGCGKTIITIAREGTELPFDVKDWTCIFYNDSRVLDKQLQKRFAIELVKQSNESNTMANSVLSATISPSPKFRHHGNAGK